MLLRGLVVVSLMVSGLLAPPANAVAPPPTRTTPAASAAAFAQAAVAPSAIQAASRKPRATLTASYVLLASGKVRVSVASNSKKVKLTYRTAKNAKRTATIKIRKGTGAKTLAKGSKKIYAKARATTRLRASVKVPVLPAATPVEIPPVVVPPAVTPPVVPPPVVSPPPVGDATAPGPVTGLTVTATTADSISLSWTNPTDTDLAEVIVRRAVGATPPGAPTEGTGIALAAPKAATVTDSGLEPDTAYAYSVFTRDTVGNTSGAVGISAQTMANSQPTPVQSSVSAQIGSRAAVPLADITQLTNLTADSSPAGVTWDASGGALSVNVAMSAPLGSATATLAATGCVNADCDRRLAITIVLDVTGMEAPAGVPLDDYVGPSPDRIAAAKNLTSGVAVLVDEATIVLAEPGTRQTADDIARGVGAVVAGGDSELAIYQLRWPSGQDIEARLDALVADPRVASAEGGLLMDKAPAAAAYDDEEAYGPAGSTQFRNNTWHLDLINAPQAWAAGATGSGVSIGILELGHVLGHPDLPTINRKGDVFSSPRYESLHATHVAGLACAQDNGIGVIGVAYGCALRSRSIASTVTLQEDLDVLKDLIRSGARVINNSWDRRPDPRCWPVESTRTAHTWRPAGRATPTKSSQR